MKPDKTGQPTVNVVLDAVPEGVQRLDIQALLSLLFPGKTDDEIQVLISSVPVTLISTSSIEKAKKLIFHLNNRGARAHLERTESIYPEASPPSQKQTSASVETVVEKKNESTPRPTSNKRIYLLLTLLVTVATFALFFSPIAPWPFIDYRLSTPETSMTPATDDKIPESALGSIPQDKRLVNGLAEAIRIRRSLSESSSNTEFVIHTEIIPLDPSEYQVNITVDGETRSLKLASNPNKWDSNLGKLRQAVDRFAAAPANSGTVDSSSVETSIPLSSTEMFLNLTAIDKALDNNPTPSGALLDAARQFAWQGFFKSALEDDSLSEQFAARSVANYLAAGVQDPETEFLVLLSLDIPAAAMEKQPQNSTAPVFVLLGGLSGTRHRLPGECGSNGTE